jgi:hypothetical protein
VNHTLRNAAVGVWDLVSFVARDTATGEGRCPLGAAPRGLIRYTDGGHMSAQLAESGMAGYVAYGGRFSVDEATWTVTDDVGVAAGGCRPVAASRPRLTGDSIA